MAEPGAWGGGPHDARHADGEHAAGGAVAAALSYPEALAYLESLGRFGIKLGLDRSRALLEALGSPERGCRGALVGGTNGKGSTTAFLEAILRAGGLRTGMTPSPHLRSYTERVRLDGRPISEADFAAAVAGLRARTRAVVERMGEPTEFEFLVAMAIAWLAPRTDRLVIEVGMGGRLDSTNVLDLGVAVITNVGLDHQRHLGRTLEAIAVEKAGIVKAGNLVVTAAAGRPLAVIERACAEAGATLWRLGRELRLSSRDLGAEGSEIDLRGPGFRYDGLRIRLLGSVQPLNAALAVAAAHGLGDAGEAAVRAGLASAWWPGRLQLVDSGLLIDGGHNPAALYRLVPDVRGLAAGRRLVLVFGTMRDKRAAPMLAALRRLGPAAAVFTAAPSAGSRAADPDRLASLWPGAEVVADPQAAVLRARELAGGAGLVLACGSLYLAGDLLPARALWGPAAGGGVKRVP